MKNVGEAVVICFQISIFAESYTPISQNDPKYRLL